MPLRVWQGAVAEEWIDYNGHMSEGFYGLVFAMASDEYLIRMGFGAEYRARSGGSFYTVETHVVFLDELAVAAPLAVDTLVAGVDSKRLKLFHELRNLDTGGLAATQESMLLHVDTSTDRTSAMGEQLYAVARADAERHAGELDGQLLGRAIRPVQL